MYIEGRCRPTRVQSTLYSNPGVMEALHDLKDERSSKEMDASNREIGKIRIKALCLERENTGHRFHAGWTSGRMQEKQSVSEMGKKDVVSDQRQ